MMGKILFVAGAATGYVLGTRAGREAYENLKVRVDKIWNSDKVQSGIRETKSRVAEKAPELRKKAEDALGRGSDSDKSGKDKSDKDKSDKDKSNKSGSNKSDSDSSHETSASDTGPNASGMDTAAAAGNSDSSGSGSSENADADKPGT